MGDLEEAKVYVGNVIGKDLLGNDMFVFKEAGFVKGDIKMVERPKFKVGDKVMIRKGCKSTSKLNYYSFLNDYIGKELTVKGYTSGGNVRLNEGLYNIAEEWLEPYNDELKYGDWAIFWDDLPCLAFIRIYKGCINNKHHDGTGVSWDNAIKFESKEQYEKILKGKEFPDNVNFNFSKV